MEDKNEHELETHKGGSIPLKKNVRRSFQIQMMAEYSEGSMEKGESSEIKESHGSIRTVDSLVILLLIVAVGVTAVILYYTQDWTSILTNLLTAWASIALAIIAIYTLRENHRVIIETQIDRRIQFLIKQLEEYYIHLKEMNGTFELGSNLDIYDEKLIRDKLYLASPAFRIEFETYLTKRKDVEYQNSMGVAGKSIIKTTAPESQPFKESSKRIKGIIDADYDRMLTELQSLTLMK